MHEKIDDDDGHYIVTEDMPIGPRCESTALRCPYTRFNSADILQIESVDY